uniref:Uncharacterized protein n=1 Tax=Rhipicephalus microplus TaxID=6941 RepID=A0A6G5AG02_RHIMP
MNRYVITGTFVPHTSRMRCWNRFHSTFCELILFIMKYTERVEGFCATQGLKHLHLGRSLQKYIWSSSVVGPSLHTTNAGPVRKTSSITSVSVGKAQGCCIQVNTSTRTLSSTGAT